MTAIFSSLKETYKLWYLSVAVFLLSLITVCVGFADFTLFHTLIEVFGVFIVFLVFVITVNASRLESFHGVLKVLGIAALFVGIVNILHSYAFLNIIVTKSGNVNLALQLRSVSRLIESVSILFAFIYIKKQYNFRSLFILYFMISSLLLGVVLGSNSFPACYIEGTGATVFKLLCGYAFLIMMGIGLFLLIKNRNQLNKNLFLFLNAYIVLVMISEMLLIYNSYDRGITGISAHLLKVMASYYLYKAVATSGILFPYQELRESQERYSKIFEFSVIGIAVVGTDRIVLSVNSALCKITGYSESELLQSGFMSITHPDDRDKTAEGLEKLHKGEVEHYIIEKRYIHKKGHTIWVLLNVSSVVDEDGETIYFMGQLIDITNRKTAEEKLRYSENRYRLLIESLPYSFVVLDKNWRYILVNDLRQAKALNMTKEEVIGKTVFELWPGFEKYNLFQVYKRVMALGQPESVAEKLLFADGTSGWRKFSVFPVSEGIMVLGQDITKQVEAESALQVSRKNYKKLVEMMPDGILLTNVKGMITYINPVGLKIVGAEAETQVIGNSIYDFTLPEEHEYFEKLAKNLHDNKGSGIIEMNMIDMRGNRKTLKSSAIPFTDEDEFGVLVVFTDITDEKQALQLQSEIEVKTKQLNEVFEMDRLRTEFFANLSHEFRTPLNIILSATQLLRSYLKDGADALDINKLLKSEGYIRQNCYRLLRLINNLIDSTKLDANFYELRLVNCNIVEVIENITLSVADYMDEKELECCFDTDVEERIIAIDPNAMERIMLNLLANAIKFTVRGGSILVELIDGEDFVTVVVRDTGIGIPQESLCKIFERFTQAGVSLAKRKEGSGIGLSLVKSLVEMHGGSIDIQSVYGEGTTLTIKLPVRLVENSNDNMVLCNEMKKLQTESIQIEFSDIYF